VGITTHVHRLPATLARVPFGNVARVLFPLAHLGTLARTPTPLYIAYRESRARVFSGPELFAPVSDLDPLKAVIDPVTTALGLPIAGLKTLNSQGTMGFYFRVGEEFYAATARHVLFPEGEGNNPYSYVGTFFSPRR
jgi:hypothetical protein